MSERKKLGIKAQDIEEAVMNIRLRRAAGEKLSRREELILAYSYHRPACHHPKHR